MTPNRLIAEFGAPAKADRCLACGRPFGIEPLIWYRSLGEISRRMSWAPNTVLRMNQAQGFWLFKLPNPNAPGWCYQTNDYAIHLWMQAQATNAYEHIARTSLGRRLRRTRASKPSATQSNTIPQLGENKGESNPRLITNIMSPLTDISIKLTEIIEESGQPAPQGGGVKPPLGQGD